VVMFVSFRDCAGDSVLDYLHAFRLNRCCWKGNYSNRAGNEK